MLSTIMKHTWMSSTTVALNLAPNAMSCSPTCNNCAPCGFRSKHLFSAKPVRGEKTHCCTSVAKHSSPGICQVALDSMHAHLE